MTSGQRIPRPPRLSPGAVSRSVDQSAALDRLAELIASSPHNLVSRGDRVGVRDVHIRECESVGLLLDPKPGSRWLDLGTGGGLPGLVLAVQFPETTWTLMDATGKKVQAVRSFIIALELSNAEAVQGRAEELGQERGYHAGYDGVVSRAVAPLPLLLDLSRGFLGDSGVFAAIKGPRVDAEIVDAERARRLLHYGVVHRQDVAGAARPTTLVTMRAQGSPPRRATRWSGFSDAAPRGGRPR